MRENLKENTEKRRAIILLLDSVGCGEAPDAAAFGDVGSDTLGHVAAACPEFALPNLQALGLGNIRPLAGVPAVKKPLACYGRMREVAAGKDTTCGHWEIAGTPLKKPLPTYPQAFPAELIAELTAALTDHPQVAGYCYTQLTDIEQEQNGLYKYDRSRKFGDKVYDAIRKANTQTAAIEE